MAQLDVSRRFAGVLVELENGLTVSLPLAGPFGELLFFFDAGRTDEGGLLLRRIDRIALRSAEGVLTVKTPEDCFSAAELARLTDVPLPQGPVGAEAIALVRQFYEAYDRALPLLLGSGDLPALSSTQRQALADYLQALCRIVPAGPLREAYRKLGADTFAYISRETGLHP